MGLFGGIEKLFGSNGAKKPFYDNQQLAKGQADWLKQQGDANNNWNQELANQIMGGYKDFKLNTDNTVNQALQGIDRQQMNDEAKLANMGMTGRSNNAFSNLYSDYASKKATTEEEIRNNANQAMFQNQMNALGQAGNAYNQGYNNQMNAYNDAYGGQMNANNALGAYLAGQGQNRLSSIGSILGGAASFGTGMYQANIMNKYLNGQ
ncbi:MAG: hypothetical protein FWE18_03730 [Alphaproteobacteria bacterium]|nr:hypothetical protein [Alphaproteobacteria bacterium]